MTPPHQREGELTLTRARHCLSGASDALSILPIGDVHADSPACDLDGWRRFLSACRKRNQAKTLYFGTGDLLDIGSRTEREALRLAKLHDQTRDSIDKVAQQYVAKVAADLHFSRGRWLGMLSGNHDWEFQDGTTATSRVAMALDAPLLGSLAYIALGLDMHGMRTRLDIVAHHGKAGGKLAGTTINQVADLRTIFPAADIYIMGHDHQRGAWPQAMLHVSGNAGGCGGLRLTARRQWLCRAGSFLRAYVPGQSSYAAARLLRPADLGAIELRIGMREDHGTRVPDVQAIV